MLGKKLTLKILHGTNYLMMRRDTHSNFDLLRTERNSTFIEPDIRNNEVTNIGNPNE
jgi:hypothetical protein